MTTSDATLLLAQSAGLRVAVSCALVSLADSATICRHPEAVEFALEHDLALATVGDIVSRRSAPELAAVRLVGSASRG
jgi:3,4-dihydroxy-2-butanone 4-phosphate synthase